MARQLTQLARKQTHLLKTYKMATAELSSQESKKTVNRLSQEKSPYLLQHATNPVNWYPWGEEAFMKAKAENKLIFLSVGYSTCHWCHVMERESFESTSIAKILNDHFVSIKVDREERPDVDRVYMTFIQATQGGGGWPMSVFLTPDLKPFIGGTYFPPEDGLGRPGFATILNAIHKQWTKDHDQIKDKMAHLITALQDSVTICPADPQLPGSGCIQRGAETLAKSFDKEYGGFGRRPKFPQPVMLDFLLRVYARYPSSEMGQDALKSILFTLKAMSKGGIHDHIGQGFHQYSTDQSWHVPHFEKMLYDQGQLVCVYLDAYQITKDEDLADTARDILVYVSRDLSDKDGGFYSAEDADSYPDFNDTHKREGAFCVWTLEEIKSLLPDPLPGGTDGKTLADLVACHYGIKEGGNVQGEQDPHGELKNQNVLIISEPVDKLATQFSLKEEVVKTQLAKAKEILYNHRQKRPKPHRDDKILTAWNGLMISGLSRAAQVLRGSEYLKLAEKAATFIKENLYNKETGMLLRNAYRDTKGDLSVSNIEGFADDYSFLICGLLDLYEASLSPCWLEWAYKLQVQQDALFWDTKGGGYFSTSGKDTSILIKIKEDQDGSEPSPNSVSVLNLLRLSSLLNKPELRSRAEDIFKTFNNHMTEHPAALGGMVSSYISYLQKGKQIIIVGSLSSEDTQQLLQCVHSFYIPNKTLLLHDPQNPCPLLVDNLSVLQQMNVLMEEKATVYVCENYQCSRPTNNVKVLSEIINPKKSMSV